MYSIQMLLLVEDLSEMKMSEMQLFLLGGNGFPHPIKCLAAKDYYCSYFIPLW